MLRLDYENIVCHLQFQLTGQSGDIPLIDGPTDPLEDKSDDENLDVSSDSDVQVCIQVY